MAMSKELLMQLDHDSLVGRCLLLQDENEGLKKELKYWEEKATSHRSHIQREARRSYRQH